MIGDNVFLDINDRWEVWSVIYWSKQYDTVDWKQNSNTVVSLTWFIVCVSHLMIVVIDPTIVVIEPNDNDDWPDNEYDWYSNDWSVEEIIMLGSIIKLIEVWMETNWNNSIHRPAEFYQWIYADEYNNKMIVIASMVKLKRSEWSWNNNDRISCWSIH